MEYTASYVHSDSDTPGRIDLSASNDAEAIELAREFVTAGYINGTSVNMTLSDGAYQCSNLHGEAVGERTYY